MRKSYHNALERERKAYVVKVIEPAKNLADVKSRQLFRKDSEARQYLRQRTAFYIPAFS
jgi:hypothetical protein